MRDVVTLLSFLVAAVHIHAEKLNILVIHFDSFAGREAILDPSTKPIV